MQRHQRTRLDVGGFQCHSGCLDAWPSITDALENVLEQAQEISGDDNVFSWLLRHHCLDHSITGSGSIRPLTEHDLGLPKCRLLEHNRIARKCPLRVHASNQEPDS